MAEQQQVNLNSAGRDELTGLVEVGDDCAERIIHHREKHGRIEDIEERVDNI